MNEHLIKNWLKNSHELPSKPHPFNSSSPRMLNHLQPTSPGPGTYNPPVKDIRILLSTQNALPFTMLPPKRGLVLSSSFSGCSAAKGNQVSRKKKTTSYLAPDHTTFMSSRKRQRTLGVKQIGSRLQPISLLITALGPDTTNPLQKIISIPQVLSSSSKAN